MSSKIIKKINKILSCDFYLKELFCIPESGCTVKEIQKTEKILNVEFSKNYKELLTHWNGLNLDIIRIFGCGKTEISIPTLFEYQIDLNKNGFIILASDPSGFLYAENNKNRKIVCIDTDGDCIEEIALHLEDFICNLVFGERAQEFAGEEWKRELIEAGILEKTSR